MLRSVSLSHVQNMTENVILSSYSSYSVNREYVKLRSGQNGLLLGKHFILPKRRSCHGQNKSLKKLFSQPMINYSIIWLQTSQNMTIQSQLDIEHISNTTSPTQHTILAGFNKTKYPCDQNIDKIKL